MLHLTGDIPFSWSVVLLSESDLGEQHGGCAGTFQAQINPSAMLDNASVKFVDFVDFEFPVIPNIGTLGGVS